MNDQDAVTALCRFGLGGRPGDLATVRSDPRGWLIEQLDAAAPASGEKLPSSAELSRRLTAMKDESGPEDMRKVRREHYNVEVTRRLTDAVASTQPFRERLVGFFSNHLTVSIERGIIVGIVGAFEREVVRPHVFGRYVDMLTAAALHPAMLLYLDNVRSMGPRSLWGSRRGKGLNENLAREVLELHTLGVDGGYSQRDVESLAAILTGWSVDRDTGRVVLRLEAHEPGVKTLMGTDYDGLEAENEVKMALEELARHPSTARHLATKLVRHFVADDPPEGAVDELAALWVRTDGDLGAVARWLVDTDHAWSQPLSKIKSPWDYVVSAGRALGLEAEAARGTRSLNWLGQQTWAAPSPAGWPDEAEAWVAPALLLRRIEFAHGVGRVIGTRLDPVQRALDIHGTTLSPSTRDALARTGRGPMAVAMWLSSPDFQRR